MATHLRANTGIDTAVEIVDAIAAGLEGDEATRSLAAVWVALIARGDGISADLKAKRRLARRARVRVAVADASWDRAVRAFSRAVLDAVDNKRDSATYLRFFRGATASQIQNYGVDREVEEGRHMALELETMAGSLQSHRAPIAAATDALAAAASARKDAVRAVGPLLTAQFLYVEDVNLEIDRLEGALQGLFPGEPARVSAFLSALRREESPPPSPVEPPPA
jgi:hypothetical protein